MSVVNKVKQNKRKDFTQANLAAARLILRHPERYVGLPLAWARRVMANLREEKLHARFLPAEEKL